MELTEKEAHCIARLLQGAWYAQPEQGLAGSLAACQYCKYQCYKTDGNNRLNSFYDIKRRLSEETGVEIRCGRGGDLVGSAFPYIMFLKNANEEVKEYFRTRFSYI